MYHEYNSTYIIYARSTKRKKNKHKKDKVCFQANILTRVVFVKKRRFTSLKRIFHLNYVA